MLYQGAGEGHFTLVAHNRHGHRDRRIFVVYTSDGWGVTDTGSS